MPELKPCPFCGEKAVSGKSEFNLDIRPRFVLFYVHCGNSRCPACPEVGMSTEHDAIEAWNTRK